MFVFHDLFIRCDTRITLDEVSRHADRLFFGGAHLPPSIYDAIKRLKHSAEKEKNNALSDNKISINTNQDPKMASLLKKINFDETEEVISSCAVHEGMMIILKKDIYGNLRLEMRENGKSSIALLDDDAIKNIFNFLSRFRGKNDQ